MTKRQKSNSSSTIITPSSSSMIDQEAYRIALVKLFMALELSFRMVEHEAFQEFVRIIAPSFVVISHTTLAWDILSLWSSEKLAHVYVWMQPVHVEEHKNQLHLLLRVEKFSPSQIDAISGVLLLISCPLEWGAPTFDAGHAFGMVAYKAASRLTSATPPPAHVLSCGIGWQGIEILLNGLFGTLTGSIVSV
ncbi:hypothetical protein JHK82_050318 [Glycine max]|nr:hypothetical protein JHK82_050318 [Glycine max]